MTLSDRGTSIDPSNEAPIDVTSPGIATRESRQNETTRSAPHPRKHHRPTEVTDDGREIDERLEQPEKAKSSIDEMREFEPDSIETIDLCPSKQ
jgi:hypothetical protein